ncbi:hypothetical protein ACIPJ2_07325 [Curtobacterium sp. NPDC090217]|uniref:hypothetical protein n=1 Tax=Curtobacterium sp. NPDC090217 TaxID=3363970 RepID=UPI003827FE4F
MQASWVVVVAVAAALVGGGAWIGVAASDDGGVRRIADRVAVPSGWELEHEELTRGAGLCLQLSGFGHPCPSVTRTYSAPPTLDDAAFRGILDRSDLGLRQTGSCTPVDGAGLELTCGAEGSDERFTVRVSYTTPYSGSKDGSLRVSVTPSARPR